MAMTSNWATGSPAANGGQGYATEAAQAVLRLGQGTSAIAGSSLDISSTIPARAGY